MSDRKRTFPGLRPVVIAAVAGLATGAIAVYVTGGPSGNPQQVASTPAPAPRTPDACAAKAEIARTVAASATGEVAAVLAADPPQSLTDLALNDPQGRPITMASLSGKVLLVNLWATWCAPCRAEMPALDELQAKAGGDDFEVVAINVDTGDDVKPRKFLEETKIAHLAYYREPTLALFNDLKRRGLALGLPVTLLVDKEGCLIGHMNGPAEWASDDALRLVEAARAL
jgi:thiol-disulfide isomerase/thioredoxin